MKKGMFLLVSCICVAFAFGQQQQQPEFLSPYKDGHPVPESVKDHTIPAHVNLLQYNKRTDDKPAKAITPADNNTAVTTDDKKPPVVANSKRK